MTNATSKNNQNTFADEPELKMNSIPSLKSLEYTGNIKTKFKQEKLDHSLAYRKMR
jgi:hypothetical protein